MIHFRHETNQWRFAWILLGKIYVKNKGPALPQGVLWPANNSLPLEQLSFNRLCRNTRRGSATYFFVLSKYTALRGCFM